jgi:hypothetical protein
LGAILDTPGLAERLLEALRPELMASVNHRRETQGRENRRESLHHESRDRTAGAEGRQIR